MKRILAAFAGVASFVLLASMTGAARNVAFSLPGMLIVAIAAAVCFGDPIKNVFDPLKGVSVLYALAFAIIPAMLNPPDLAQYSRAAIQTAQWTLLVYFCLLLLGYKMWRVFFPVVTPPHALYPHTYNVDPSGVLRIAGFIFMVGLACYLYAILKAGGVGALINFRGTRAHLLANSHGIFHRFSLFMASGYALFAVATIRKHTIRAGVVALVLAVLYSAFMGRSLAITPILIFAVVYHYQIKRVKARYVVIGAMAGIVLLSMTAILRSAGKDRKAMLDDPVAFFKQYANVAETHIEHTLLNYAEFLDTFMLEKGYVESGDPLLHGHSLTTWFEPFDRNLFGDRLTDSVNVGNFVKVLKSSYYKDKASGTWPTMPGEMLLNFGFFGAGIGMLCYGACIQMISRLLKSGTGSLLAMAIHPYVYYIAVRGIYTGTYHFTYIVIFISPLLLVSLFIKKQSCRIEWLSPHAATGNSMPAFQA